MKKLFIDYDRISWNKYLDYLKKDSENKDIYKYLLREHYKGEEIIFGLVFTTFKKDEKIRGKIVFGMTKESTLSDEFKDKFSEALDAFIHLDFEDPKNIAYALQVDALYIEHSDEEIVTANCGVIYFDLGNNGAENTIIAIEHCLIFLYEFVLDFNLFKVDKKYKTIELTDPGFVSSDGIVHKDLDPTIPSWLQSGAKDEKLKGSDFLKKDDKRLSDIVLNKDLKSQIEGLIERYTNPNHFKKWNTSLPRGLILYGPPGTGKTTIAKVIANEMECNFYTLSSSDIVTKWIGESAQNLEMFLKKVKKNSIIFMDEFDALLPSRGTLGINNERQDSERISVVNTFLEYLDGVKKLDDVLFIGATNRIDNVDSSFLRPGRFDLKMFIDLPDRISRRKLWDMYLKKAQNNISYQIYDKNLDFDYLAKITNKFTGADIQEIIRRIMNDYATWTLSSVKTLTISPKKTYEGILYNIEKFKEENALDKGIIPQKEKLYLEDIGGQLELKAQLQSLIMQIKNKQIFDELNIDMPKGLLLYGPPGTGKTLAARVIANEAEMLFYQLSAKDFMGAGGIQALESKFDSLQSPSIVFIDEIDAIGITRKLATSLDRKILNTFLQKMDGFTQADDIFFIAATNDIDILDEALTRAGRFDIKILVDNPDATGRKEIFTMYINKSLSKKGERLFQENLDINSYVDMTNGLVGADIKEIIRRLKQNLALDIIEKKLPLSKLKITNQQVIAMINRYKRTKNKKLNIIKNLPFNDTI